MNHKGLIGVLKVGSLKVEGLGNKDFLNLVRLMMERHLQGFGWEAQR
jgi:hypothetical protein